MGIFFLTFFSHQVTAETRHGVSPSPTVSNAQPWANVSQRHQPFVFSLKRNICIFSISLLSFNQCNLLSILCFVRGCISNIHLSLSPPFLFLTYNLTAFTNKTCKYFQTLFLQHPAVRVTVNGFTERGGLLTLCSLLTCCRWWPVECPAEPGMRRPFGHEAARADCAGRIGVV